MSANSVPLYADDSHLTEFDATVVRAGPRFVVLDRTAFYPDSGGQPSDVGVLRHVGGEARVLKVVKRGLDIFHYLDADLPIGAAVHGVIDWPTRRWNMRRHSAEHLITGLIEALGEPPKVFSDLEKLEYQPSGLTEEQIRGVGRRFDEIVDEDAPVRVYYEERAKIDASGDLRKIGFLQKIPRSVVRLRIVDIGNYASTFCFGTHVKSTGEIGRLAELRLEDGKKGKKVVHFRLES
ncbi:MAG: alanyl-tRNA editing protein [Candidatus Bathyarchaeota archaeon]|nr:alanyl-tRNA editing protein [Candidatus Bathyarchaeota archaeon]